MNKKVLWECLCDCGQTTFVRTCDLTSKNSMSCGCLSREMTGNIRKSHQMTKTPLYNVWCGIKQRCEYKKHVAYDRYGGKGIKMSDEWKDFMTFYNDMSEGYSKGLSIERLDSNGDYCKSNCKWATTTEQANNKKNNRIVTVDGVTDTLANTCRIHGFEYFFVLRKLHSGETMEEIVTQLRSV